MQNVTITKAKSEGKTKAYVKITEGRMAVTFNLVEMEGEYYLNPPSAFIPTLKGKTWATGRKSSGHIDQAYITDKAYKKEILEFAKKEIGVN